MANDNSQTTVLTLETRDTLSIENFKIYVVAVEHGGLALRIESQRKKPKSQYLDVKRGTRLNGDISIKLDSIKNRVAKVSIVHVKNKAPKFLDGRMGRLVMSRRRGQQLIVDGGAAVITIKNISASRCAIWVAHKNKHLERVLVVGEAPITVLPNIKMAYFGFSDIDENGAKLLTIAPKSVRIDRHEVHLNREFGLDVLHSAPAELKQQHSKRRQVAG